MSDATGAVGMPAGGTETILLVEDVDAVRAMAAEALRGAGYTVLEAPDGPAAVALFEKHQGPLHLLLTDYVMPTMNGHELARVLCPRKPEMRVLYISGYVEQPDVQRGVLQGVFKEGAAFLQKPFKGSDIVRKVRTVLRDA